MFCAAVEQLLSLWRRCLESILIFFHEPCWADNIKILGGAANLEIPFISFFWEKTETPVVNLGCRSSFKIGFNFREEEQVGCSGPGGQYKHYG